MKKLALIVILLLCLSMMFTLASCGSKDGGTETAAVGGTETGNEQSDTAHADPEAIVTKCLEAEKVCDGSFLHECLHPSVIEYYADLQAGGNVEAFRKGFIGEWDDLKEEYKDSVLSFEIHGSESITGDEFDELKELYKEEFGIDISQAVNVSLWLGEKGIINGEEVDTSNEITIISFMADGKWYVDPEFIMG